MVAALSFWLRPFWSALGRGDIFLVSCDGKLADKVTHSQLRRIESTSKSYPLLFRSNFRGFHFSEHLEHSQPGSQHLHAFIGCRLELTFSLKRTR